MFFKLSFFKWQGLLVLLSFNHCLWWKNIINVSGVKLTTIFFYHRLIECKENNVSSFLHNLLLATMYTCWKIKGRIREICNLIKGLFERNSCSHIHSTDMPGTFVPVFNIQQV